MNTTIRFLHLRRPRLHSSNMGVGVEQAGNRGGLTVAYRDLGDGDYQVAIARCRADEHYVRKLGREAAYANLTNPRNACVIHTEKGELYDALLRYAFKVAPRGLRADITYGASLNHNKVIL